MPSTPYKIFLLGGYGFFGTHLLHLLASIPNISITIAGRNLRAAYRLIADSKHDYPSLNVKAIRLDLTHQQTLYKQLQQEQVNLLIDLTGDLDKHQRITKKTPTYPKQQYFVAKICLELGIHYIDFANTSGQVLGIEQFSDQAQEKSIMMTSGSGLLALSSALIDYISPQFKHIDRVDIGTSFGNKTQRGLESIKSLLRDCGKAINVWRHGKVKQVTAWQGGLSLIDYPAPIGRRWLSLYDAPDHAILPKYYPNIRSIHCRMGLELPIFHFGLVGLSTLSKCFPRWNLQRIAPKIKALANFCKNFGSSNSVMHIALFGYNAADKATQHQCLLIAEKGHGAYLPLLACSALLRKIAAGYSPQIGAFPFAGLIDWDEIQHELGFHKNLAIQIQID